MRIVMKHLEIGNNLNQYFNINMEGMLTEIS